MKVTISIIVKFGDEIDLDKKDFVRSYETKELPETVFFTPMFESLGLKILRSIHERAADDGLLPEAALQYRQRVP